MNAEWKQKAPQRKCDWSFRQSDRRKNFVTEEEEFGTRVSKCQSEFLEALSILGTSGGDQQINTKNHHR